MQFLFLIEQQKKGSINVYGIPNLWSSFYFIIMAAVTVIPTKFSILSAAAITCNSILWSSYSRISLWSLTFWVTRNFYRRGGGICSIIDSWFPWHGTVASCLRKKLKDMEIFSFSNRQQLLSYVSYNLFLVEVTYHITIYNFI